MPRWASTISGSSRQVSQAQVLGRANCGSTITAASSSPLVTLAYRSFDEPGSTKSVISGYFTASSDNIGGRMPVSALDTAPRARRPAKVFSLAMVRRSRTPASRVWTWGRMDHPASVGRTVRPERETSAMPSSASSAFRRWVTPAGVRLRRRAASATEPCSTTRRKLSRNCVSIPYELYLLQNVRYITGLCADDLLQLHNAVAASVYTVCKTQVFAASVAAFPAAVCMRHA